MSCLKTTNFNLDPGSEDPPHPYSDTQVDILSRVKIARQVQRQH